jgi:hypothetical protein
LVNPSACYNKFGENGKHVLAIGEKAVVNLSLVRQFASTI